MSDNDDDDNAADDAQQRQRQRRADPLPSRYSADGKTARWEMLWLDRCGRGQHVDDDGADASQRVDGVLPPLPDEAREESKRHGGGGTGQDANVAPKLP